MHELELMKFQEWLTTKFKDSLKQAMKEAIIEAQKENQDGWVEKPKKVK